ncbi:thioredoxin domain-containing protein [Aestuariibaculum marinum]|uniref:Thioredoxin domain-containing protein n=1 Tax=Aestuariibaculum marinum TaxID=2683592 RepID=A0A8J6PWR3_9FLAO|nr:thioredoxin domain-containing protein [Aestuariibaculum marinum]MBD0825439.1 thioredoxin domain-containing protein [Aestuariibaculum marinum]
MEIRLNHLAAETSPYLLQHSSNPVDWYPWADEVLSSANTKNKLLIISIGYSTCHWCHVMEEESFSDTEVAKVMNQDFINIKVDREERPDVDQVYMTAAQMMNGSGGWPLNVIALPDGRPVFIGSYMEKDVWTKVLKRFNAHFKSEPEKLYEYAAQVSEGLEEIVPMAGTMQTNAFSLQELEEAMGNWKRKWDTQWGGDQATEKFMLPVKMKFLLKYAVMLGDKDAYKQVMLTLDKMALGGIFDHIGGGFFRYATDYKWQVPHFEKMLYDNAQMIDLYVNAYKASKDSKYRNVVYTTFSFLENNMANGKGGYYAAIDADSDGEEGRFYLWNDEELQNVLGVELDDFSKVFNTLKVKLDDEGVGYVLQPVETDSVLSKRLDVATEELLKNKEKWKRLLLERRDKRVKPLTDKKVISSWNAQLASAYIEAYMAFGDETFLKRGIAIHKFIKENLMNGNQLYHSYISKQVGNKGFLEDYAFYINMLINLFRATTDLTYLDEARHVLERTNALFYDAKKGFYNFVSEDELITQVIKLDDGVNPSPNAVMAQNLLQLGNIYFDKDYKNKGKTMLVHIQSELGEYLPYYTLWASELLNFMADSYEVAIIGDEAKSMLKDINKTYLPNALIVGSPKNCPIAIFEDRYTEGGTYIYICQENMCKLPMEKVELAIKQIQENYEEN